MTGTKDKDKDMSGVGNFKIHFFGYHRIWDLTLHYLKVEIITGDINIYSLILMNNMKLILRQWGLIPVTCMPIAAGRVYQ